MSSVARQLQARHHEVVIFSLTAFEPLARAANLSFIPFGEDDLPAEKIAGIVQKLSSMKGEEGLQFTFDAIALITEAKWRTLPKLLAASGCSDAVVMDANSTFIQQQFRGISGSLLPPYRTQFTSTSLVIRPSACTTGRTK